MKNFPKIQIVPYNEKWPAFFKQEAEQIKIVLGDQLKEIYHIGSTAIPNMPAKPVIDILLVCDNLDKIEFIVGQLKSLNYLHIKRQIIPHLSFFIQRQGNDINMNLHIYERGDPQINRHVNFRDYVIGHSNIAKTYADSQT